MARIAGVDLPREKRVEIGLTYIYGIGLTTSQKILKETGINPDTNLVEVVELENHPWFIGVQYQPEYKSTVQNPHPLFVSFVKAATDYCQTHNSK